MSISTFIEDYVHEDGHRLKQAIKIGEACDPYYDEKYFCCLWIESYDPDCETEDEASGELAIINGYDECNCSASDAKDAERFYQRVCSHVTDPWTLMKLFNYDGKFAGLEAHVVALAETGPSQVKLLNRKMEYWEETAPFTIESRYELEREIARDASVGVPDFDEAIYIENELEHLNDEELKVIARDRGLLN